MTMSFGNIILWIVFGGLAGWLASLIVGTDANLGITGNIVVGVIGAFLGGWIADRVGADNKPGAERPSNVAAFFWAVIGAIVLLIVLNLIWGMF